MGPGLTLRVYTVGDTLCVYTLEQHINTLPPQRFLSLSNEFSAQQRGRRVRGDDHDQSHPLPRRQRQMVSQ